MTLLEALLLGFVQGVTEFLPVSSSAHLVFFQSLLGVGGTWRAIPLLLFFNLVLHLGTVVSLLLYFARDLTHLLRDSIYAFFFLLQRKRPREIFKLAPQARWAWGILIASFPTALIGLLFRDPVEAMFGSLRSVGFALFVTSAVLWGTRFCKGGGKRIEAARTLDFLALGVVQGLAILPGISRLGMTLATGIFLGFRQEEAFRFSLFLSIPVILGGGVFEGSGLLGGGAPGPGLLLLGVGFVSAFSSGLFALSFLSPLVERGKLHPFAVYTFSFGCLLLALSPWLG